MGVFIEFVFDMLEQFFGGLWRIISNFFLGIYDTINIGEYIGIFGKYYKLFNVLEFILAILVCLVLLAIITGAVVFLVLRIRALIRARRSLSKQAALLDEIGSLNAQVIRLAKEKERILAMKLGVDGNFDEITDENDENTSVLKDGESRFYKLTQVDLEYKDYVREDEVFDNEITLPLNTKMTMEDLEYVIESLVEILKG